MSFFTYYGRISVSALLLSGCAVGPDYVKPELSVPAEYHSSIEEGEAAGTIPLSLWWHAFNDPLLDSLIERAVKSNHDIRTAEGRIREVRAQKGITDAGLWPEIDATASVTNNRVSGNSPQGSRITDNEYDLFEAGFDASWEIDIFGGLRREKEAAKADLDAALEGRNAVLVSLLGDVARNYIELRGAQRQLSLTRENLKAQEETLELIEVRYRAGLNSYLDVSRGKSLVSTTRAQIPGLERSVMRSIHRLGVLLGQEPNALLSELEKERDIPLPPSTITAGLPSELLLRRPDIRKAEREVAAASARLGAAKADLFPRFTLTGSFGLQGTESGDLNSSDSRFWSVGPSVRWPIFAAGRIRSSIRLQDAAYEQTVTAYEQTVLTALEDVENALVAYHNEQTRMQHLSESVEANRQSISMAAELYSRGLTDFLAVLDAHRSLLDAEMSLAQSRALTASNLVALYKALGGGWEDGPADNRKKRQ